MAVSVTWIGVLGIVVDRMAVVGDLCRAVIAGGGAQEALVDTIAGHGLAIGDHRWPVLGARAIAAALVAAVIGNRESSSCGPEGPPHHLSALGTRLWPSPPTLPAYGLEPPSIRGLDYPPPSSLVKPSVLVHWCLHHRLANQVKTGL
jgi:hypothetical protein